MKLLAALAVLVLALFGGWSWKTAQAVTLVPCYGAPADYIAQFDGVDGTVDGSVSYPEPRAFLETQSHLKPPGETSRHHFEHIHIGMCFPYAETWMQANTARTVDVRYVFHNVSNYTITKSVSQYVDAANSGGGYTATTAQLAQLQTAMDASDGGTQAVFQSYTLKTLGTSCRKTFRPEVQTVRSNPNALVDQWFAAGQWTTYIAYAGQPACNPEFNQDQIRSRSWVLPAENGGGYTYSTIFDTRSAGHMADPVADPWELALSSTNNDAQLYVDPDFHAHPDYLGLWHQDYGLINGTFTASVPLTDIPAGDHKLVYIGDRGIQSAVQVVPFKVAGVVCQ